MLLAAHRTSRFLQTRALVAAALLVGLVAAGGWLVVHPAAHPRTHADRNVAGDAPPGSPLGDLSRSLGDLAPVVGIVEERLAAGSYTYLAVRPDGGSPMWAVTLGSGQPVGARVSVRSFGRRTEFTSRRLQRTFPVLVFGVVSPARVDER
ncbi:hypothetical protein WME79_28635 [Sorangium sp. So ce726]|uniref:hypothetical protein n=1 Tax=Sorangium sp. So ce726 TaxID=3133319 RepID=UPI003F6199C0